MDIRVISTFIKYGQSQTESIYFTNDKHQLQVLKPIESRSDHNKKMNLISVRPVRYEMTDDCPYCRLESTIRINFQINNAAVPHLGSRFPN